jgi:hypothetical protein
MTIPFLSTILIRHGESSLSLAFKIIGEKIHTETQRILIPDNETNREK